MKASDVFKIAVKSNINMDTRVIEIAGINLEFLLNLNSEANKAAKSPCQPGRVFNCYQK